MNLVRTGLLNAVAVAIRVATALGINKILAIYVGPGGYAIIGQFQNFITFLTTFATGAVNTGVTKFTAEYRRDETLLSALWQTAGMITIIGTFVGSGTILVFRRQLAIWIFRSEALSHVFVWLAAGLIFFCANAVILAVLNGLKDVQRYVAINIIGNCIGLAVTCGLAVTLGLYGALVALAINQSVLFLATLVVCARLNWFRLRNFIGTINPRMAGNLSRFTVMAIAGSVSVPFSQVVIRSYLVRKYGWDFAGDWDAVNRISNVYLTLVTTPLAIYYLPRISEIREPGEVKREIVQGYRLILPVTALGCGAVYLARRFLVRGLFSAKFIGMEDLFLFQVLGDWTKIGGWIFAHVLLGRAMTKAYIATELGFAVCWTALAYVCCGVWGKLGVQYAYFAAYVIYWAALAVIVRRHMRRWARAPELTSHDS